MQTILALPWFLYPHSRPRRSWFAGLRNVVATRNLQRAPDMVRRMTEGDLLTGLLHHSKKERLSKRSKRRQNRLGMISIEVFQVFNPRLNHPHGLDLVLKMLDPVLFFHNALVE